MKRVFLSIMICFVAIFCTGCVNSSCDIEINKNNEITIQNNQGVKLQNKMLPKGFYEVLEEDLNKIVKKYSNKDNNLKTYINDYSAGVITTKEKISFDEATKFLPEGYSAVNKNAFEIKKGLFKTSYKINIIYNPETASKYVPDYYEDFKNSSETAQKFGNKLISFASESILVSNESRNSLTIKLPKKASKHNANMVISDLEYRWDFQDAKKPVMINLEYDKFKFLPW